MILPLKSHWEKPGRSQRAQDSGCCINQAAQPVPGPGVKGALTGTQVCRQLSEPKWLTRTTSPHGALGRLTTGRL